jgi:hypothetical protein
MEQLNLNRATEIVLEALAAPGNAPLAALAEHGRNLLTRYSQGNQMAASALTLFQGDPQNPALRPYVVQQIVAVFIHNQAASQELIALAQQILASRPQGNSDQRGGIHFGNGNHMGDVNIGDVAGGNIRKTDVTYGDRITTGTVSGTGIAIGHGARSNVRNVNTGGGDYAEGHMDKRSGTFVSGDQFTMSGTFSGAILNIKSTLTNVAQSIGAAPNGDTATKAQLQALIAQLSAELQKIPAEKAGEAEAVAETAKAAVEQATKAQPNTTMVQISAEGLKQAAQNLAAVLPTVVPLAERVADMLRKMIGV